MIHEIIAEDFKITPAIRAQGIKCFEQLEPLLPKKVPFHLYLSKEGPHSFVARLQVRLMKNTLYAETHNADLYQAIKLARVHLKRQILDTTSQKFDHHKREVHKPA